MQKEKSRPAIVARLSNHKHAKALSQIILLWGGSLLGAGMAFLTQVLLGRNLGLADYGSFSNALAQSILLSQVAGLGLQTFWLSAYGREGWQAKRWMPGSIKLLSATSLLSITIYLIATVASPKTARETHAFLWMMPSILGFAAVELTAAKLQLEERFMAISLWQAMHHTIRFAFIALLLLQGKDGDLLLKASIAYSLVAVILLGLTWRHIRTMANGSLNLRGHGDRPQSITPATTPTIRQTLREAWLFGIDALLYLAYFQCSNILLNYLAGNRAAGTYFSAFTIMNAVYLLPTILFTKFLLAKFHRWAQQDRSKLWQVFRTGTTAMLLAGLLSLAFLYFFRDVIVANLYGPEFAAAAPVLAILALCAPLRFMSTSIGAILTTRDQIATRVNIKIVLAALCIALNIALIPPLGAIGAAVATVITELCLLTLFSATIYMRRNRIFY